MVSVFYSTIISNTFSTLTTSVHSGEKGLTLCSWRWGGLKGPLLIYIQHMIFVGLGIITIINPISFSLSLQ